MYSHDSTAAVACRNWHPDTTSGTYLPPNTREASYAISPIAVFSHGKPLISVSNINFATASTTLLHFLAATSHSPCRAMKHFCTLSEYVVPLLRVSTCFLSGGQPNFSNPTT